MKLNNKLGMKPTKSIVHQVITQVKTLAVQENSVTFVNIILALVDICKTDLGTMVLYIMTETKLRVIILQVSKAVESISAVFNQYLKMIQ